MARHRRIHSGKRPYKCPYADCQKTFTRRTTLTRHQNHHTGTVEEAAAATAAALAGRSGSVRGGRPRSDGEGNSQYGSPMSTPSPNQRNISLSPNSELAPLNGMQRHPNEYSYMSNSSLPSHLRNDYHHMSQPQPPTTMPMQNGHQIMRPTSHPNAYGPPPILEPPANMEQRSGTGSANGSPHMATMGWQSPSHMPSPQPGNSYVYPDPDPYGPGAAMVSHMYYPNSHLRRPQSTEPDAYDQKPRMNELWAAAQ